MIRYVITPAKLRTAISTADANWFANAAAVLARLPDPPKSSDFKPLWSRIKDIYITLQHEKCCFCEKQLEGKVEQDVEHFRPKAEVKPWLVPKRLLDQGVAVRQPADGSSEPGYSQLAYSPFNYAIACKTCNSTLKKNYFPIEGARDSAATDPAQMGGEKALLIYPIGSADDDPEQLIEFEGFSPVPKSRSGFNHHRALVTIEIFRLDDSSRRRPLFKLRATFVRLLFLELERKANATSVIQSQEAQTAIKMLTSPEMPFANCLRSFERLYRSDQARAEAIAEECQIFMKTKSTQRRGT